MRRARDQRNKGRLVHIAECRMLATDDEIEFVAEDTVPIVDGQMEQEARCGQRDCGCGKTSWCVGFAARGHSRSRIRLTASTGSRDCRRLGIRGRRGSDIGYESEPVGMGATSPSTTYRPPGPRVRHVASAALRSNKALCATK